MSDASRPRPGLFGLGFLGLLVLGSLFAAVLIFTRGCGADADPLDAPEQIEASDYDGTIDEEDLDADIDDNVIRENNEMLE